MKKFLLNVSKIILIYLFFSYLISFMVPYHWGNPWYSAKIQYLESEKENKYNSYFFGSSLIYRQINPSAFDSIINFNTQETLNSFNLGAPATFTPQNYYLYEKFLDSDLSENTKMSFIELREVDLLSDYSLHQERTTYWQNFSDLGFVTRSLISNDELSIKRKLKTFFNYSLSYFEKIFRLGHFGQQLVKNDYYDKRFLGPNQDGFFSIEDDLRTTKDLESQENLRERQESIINEPELLEIRKARISKSYANSNDSYDKIHLNRILNLITLSSQKKIHLIFIIPPRNQTSELLSLSKKIPETNVIDLGNPILVKEFYEYDNSFDVGHLNKKGAELFTIKLADSVKHILTK